MKTVPSYACTGAALAAAALLTSGCRTIHRAPKPDAEPAPAPVVSDVSAAPDGTVAPAPVVLDAAQVGAPGTYKEYIIADDGADRPVAFESDGLKGQTGRHVSPPPPVPEPEPAVKVPAPTSAGAGVYVVQPGDIFGRIAQKNGVSQKALLAANPSLKDPNKIRAGQKLNLPARGTGIGVAAPAAPRGPAAAKPAKALPPKAGFTVYTVQEGDILGRIANRNKTTVKALMEANGITDPTKLRAGKQIYVPAAGAAAPAPAPAAPAPATPAAPEEAPIPPSVGDNADFLNGFAN